IVSGLGRSAGLAEVEYESFIQVDAAINPGNSGGPLTDIRGRVIGMNTAIATGRGATAGGGQFAGIGLAIPRAIVENVVGQLIEHGAVSRGFLGVQVVDARPSMRCARAFPATRR
ncbi:MAG: S1C family serine protease, partial [Phycisphaerales bacterium]